MAALITRTADYEAGGTHTMISLLGLSICPTMHVCVHTYLYVYVRQAGLYRP